MNARQHMEGLVAAWLPRLGLSHWTVTVDWSKAPDEVLSDAQTDIESPYDQAAIRFATRFDTWDTTFAEVVVVHELLHLTMRDLEESARYVREALPKGVQGLAEAWHQHELEGVIDRLAASLVAVAASRITPEGFTC